MQCSKLFTNAYSTSFSLGISLLDKSLHNAIYAIYGFVRLADEIVDSFHSFDKKALLYQIRQQTFEAIAQKKSTNPIIESFQEIVHTYNIEPAYIEAFLHSMEMDLNEKTHTEHSYQTYIYGSAEVIGLMCLRVFTATQNTLFDELKEAACSLGAAFQKVNFLRDFRSDYLERGRIYFPNLSFDNFDATAKTNIELSIEEDFVAARKGIAQLPKSARLGVYCAYYYYRALFEKMKRTSYQELKSKRIRISNFQKYLILLRAYGEYTLHLV
ncbi:MAG: phytoene/squalene synthase family protein [Chitinophagales bacterium]